MVLLSDKWSVFNLLSAVLFVTASCLSLACGEKDQDSDFWLQGGLSAYEGGRIYLTGSQLSFTLMSSRESFIGGESQISHAAIESAHSTDSRMASVEIYGEHRSHILVTFKEAGEVSIRVKPRGETHSLSVTLESAEAATSTFLRSPCLDSEQPFLVGYPAPIYHQMFDARGRALVGNIEGEHPFEVEPADAIDSDRKIIKPGTVTVRSKLSDAVVRYDAASLSDVTSISLERFAPAPEEDIVAGHTISYKVRGNVDDRELCDVNDLDLHLSSLQIEILTPENCMESGPGTAVYARSAGACRFRFIADELNGDSGVVVEEEFEIVAD